MGRAVDSTSHTRYCFNSASQILMSLRHVTSNNLFGTGTLTPYFWRLPASEYTAQFLANFDQFPPRQKPISCQQKGPVGGGFFVASNGLASKTDSLKQAFPASVQIGIEKLDENTRASLLAAALNRGPSRSRPHRPAAQGRSGSVYRARTR